MKLKAKQILITGLCFLALSGQNQAEGNNERYRQAGLPSTTAAQFAQLAKDDNVAIRQRVASNRKTPVKLLMELAHDPDMSVRIAVATNLSSDENTYLVLARDQEQAVRSVVARFEYVPVSALQLLSHDHDVDVRLEVARNLNSTKVILNDLLKDTNNHVRRIAELALNRQREE